MSLRILERVSLALSGAPGLIVAVAVAVSAAGCGGAASTAGTPPASPTTASSTPTAGATGVSVALQAPTHAPRANAPWPYVIRVTGAGGRRLDGVVDIQFILAGQVVGRDVPPSHVFRHGLWHDVLRWPARSEGYPLSFEAVVHTSAGTRTIDYPVTVHR